MGRRTRRALEDDCNELRVAQVRQRSLDASSVGVARQTDLRDRADADGYVEANLWTGIGRARSGCGAAIVGLYLALTALAGEVYRPRRIELDRPAHRRDRQQRLDQSQGPGGAGHGLWHGRAGRSAQR